MRLTVTDHAVQRACERFLAPVERAHHDLRALLVSLWHTGLVERWRDPDDPADGCTVTSAIEPHWSADVGKRYLVGRMAGSHIALVSALTVQQYERNVRLRWRRL